MPRYELTTGLPQVPAGLSDEDYGKLLPLYRAVHALSEQVSQITGRVSYSQAEMLQLNPFTNIYADRSNIIYATAGEVLTYGQLVSLAVLDGAVTARVASKSVSGRHAQAVVMTTTGAAIGDMVTLRFMHGFCAGVAGTVIGQQYWLGNSGTMQLTKPTTAGERAQVVAVGLGSAGAYINIPDMGVIV